MFSDADIDFSIPQNFYENFRLTDTTGFEMMVEDEDEQTALDLFVENFAVAPGLAYQNEMARYLSAAVSGPLTLDDESHAIRNISLLTIGLSTLLCSNFGKYVRNVQSPVSFDKAELRNSGIRKSVLSETLSSFENTITGTMAQTQAFIINAMRSLQREYIAENVILKKIKISDNEIALEVERFKSSLKVRYPDVYNAIKNGNILISKKFGPDGESVRHYTMGFYVDLAVRSSVLEIDRNSVEIMALVKEEPVVEFYLSDPRAVKEEREICQHILGNKINGKSLLAMDASIANILGIMTIDEARSTSDYAFGPYCRHSIRRLDSAFLSDIMKMIGSKNGDN